MRSARAAVAGAALWAAVLGALVGAPATARADCADKATVCVGVELFASMGGPSGEASELDRRWIQTQLEVANRHYAPLGLQWHLLSVRPLPAALARLDSPADRDRAGRGRFRRGRLLWIAPLELVDLDGVRPRHGVHWRDRRHRARAELDRHRWVIVARSEVDFVLAHEIGHYLGLPHSADPGSLMNVVPRTDPPEATWRFTDDELARMRGRLQRALRHGALQRLRRDPPPTRWGDAVRAPARRGPVRRSR